MPDLTFHEVRTGVYYCCHPDHRNNNPEKAQWTIPETDEIASFKDGYGRAWTHDGRAWGLHYVKGSPEYLGLAIDRRRHLFIARFEDGNRNERWHGYPADHQQKVNDRLPEKLKELWIKTNVLTPAKVRKLAKGEPCSL